MSENNITDILFANNIFKAYSSNIYRSYLRFLEQSDHSVFKAVTDSTTTDTVMQSRKHGHLKRDTTVVVKRKSSGDTVKSSGDSLTVN